MSRRVVFCEILGSRGCDGAVCPMGGDDAVWQLCCVVGIWNEGGDWSSVMSRGLVTESEVL